MKSIIKSSILILIIPGLLLSCTTFEERMQILDQQYHTINKKDGVDKDEAKIIAKYYIWIETDLARWNKLSRTVIDDNEHWLIDLMRIHDIGKESIDMKILIDKTSGLAVRLDIPLGEHAEKHKELVHRLEEQYERMTKENEKRKKAR